MQYNDLKLITAFALSFVAENAYHSDLSPEVDKEFRSIAEELFDYVEAFDNSENSEESIKQLISAYKNCKEKITAYDDLEY